MCLGDGGGEGDDVVADFGFDLVDAVDGEVAAVTDGVCGGLRDQAEARESLGGGGLNGEPAAVLVLVGPDAAHGGACVASDHRLVDSCSLIVVRDDKNYTPKRADISSWRKPRPGR